jgi:hypothetical protein
VRYPTSVSSPSVVEEVSERSERMSSGVPHGKRVLNTHISLEEHTFLKSMATKNSMTVTMFLRNLIRREMQRSSRELDVRQSY